MKLKIFSLLITLAFISSCGNAQKKSEKQKSPLKYKQSWESLAQHNEEPDWFQDAKLGIYFHWGIYSVPAYGDEWYPRNMHIPGSKENKHHIEKYGEPSEFGYDKFAEMFKAEHFDAEEWATLFKKAGARLVAISPEIPDSVDKTVKKTKAEYSILHDVDSKIMKQYGVDFVLAKKLQKKYKEYGIDLTVSNGNSDQTLPVPATYVIGKDGIVKYVQYDPDYKNRSNAEEILKHL